MKIFVVIALCVAVANAGFSGGSSGGWQQEQQSSGWEQQQSSGWQQQQQPQQEQKIIIIKQQGGHGGSSGGSLTVAGPTHVIKTIHQVRTIDQGGKILSKSGGGSGQQAKVLVVKEVKTATIQHAPKQQNNGWAPQQQNNGWASQQQNSGW
ncbi:uncharacterized protein LOC100908821 [Galendromus occidentalis]|uniref:Uncharacterized protein LOC100908821 n=1 Tax=Galendromus occidentalis TaxID=34638 RepID=A0AAJ6QP85_9ACAR|nr:uncharacterized protein LOC100908821 [Galendromus occidentalis]